MKVIELLSVLHDSVNVRIVDNEAPYFELNGDKLGTDYRYEKEYDTTFVSQLSQYKGKNEAEKVASYIEKWVKENNL